MSEYSFGGLGGRFQPNSSRYAAALLGRQNYNNGTHAGGVAHMAQSILQAMLLKNDMDAEQKNITDTNTANMEMVRGMTAQPWKNPDMGGAQTNIQEGTGKIVPTGPAGGYEGGMAALQNLGPGNAAAGKLSQALLMQKVGRDQQLADKADDRGFQKELFGMQDAAANARQAAGFQQQKDLIGMQPEVFGAPISVIGPDGQPALVSFGNRGGMKPIGGYQAVTDGKLPAGYQWASDGKSVVPIPGTKGAQELADAKAKDAESLAATDRILRSTDTLTTHPGREMATGVSSMFNKAQYGTDAASFLAQLDTMKSQSFLPMVAQLKGMGALSDAEGKKLTDAIGALDPNMKEQDFLNSLYQIEADLVSARQRMPGGNAAPYVPQRLQGAFAVPGVKPNAGQSATVMADDDPLGLRKR